MTTKLRGRLESASVVLALIAAGVGPVSASPAGTDLAPRRMEIALRFEPVPQNPQFKGGSGRMVIDLSGSRCTEYKLHRSTVAKLQFEGGTINLVSEATITENGEGTQLAFAITDRVNGEVKRQEAVVARKTPDGIVLTSRKLPGGSMQLPKGIVLPIHHERMADAALADKRKSLAVKIYNPEDTLTSIDQIVYTFGAEATGSLRKGHPAEQIMGNAPRYQVEMLRKDKAGKFRVREKLVRFANGVFTTSDALFDNMRIRASLTGLKLPPQPLCRQ
ncbi:MAG: DUF1849 domain-containing protein [Proteobacteria bacterium]|nr:MAG: DUF1849 domain-containing protein [Pseudomonadota bacterium]